MANMDDHKYAGAAKWPVNTDDKPVGTVPSTAAAAVSGDKPGDTKSADKTPLEWKELLRTPAYEFSPAEILHDWAAHALHANVGKLMSRAVYVAAIKAGCAPDKHGDYTPVPEAQGDFQRDGKPRS